jgi:glucokinase
MILAGDIGGTKSVMALFARDDPRTPIVERVFQSVNYLGLEEVVREFVDRAISDRQLGQRNQITAACFGLAGPVVNERSMISNLPWVISAQGLREILGVPAVKLINDLEATGYGIPTLQADELLILNEGSSQRTGHAALIAAGTGLGESILYWDGEDHKLIASEGGHADFAPRNEIEMELLRHLLDRFHRVSYERVISGPGLHNIYHFLKDAGYGQEPPWLGERLAGEDPSAVISELALSRQNELCVQALDIFVSVYGAEAGNLALTVVALGGVYVGGGIAPKIIDKLTDGTFIRAFTDKGRLSPLLESIPVRVILNPRTALYGAACCAMRLQ